VARRADRRSGRSVFRDHEQVAAVAVEDLVYVAFSMPRDEARAMEKMARRLGCANVEILLAELVKIGYRAMEQRFEPAPHALNISARAQLRGQR
jgi:hypothetical protein